MIVITLWRMYSNGMLQHYVERTKGRCDAKTESYSDIAAKLYRPFLRLRFPADYPKDQVYVVPLIPETDPSVLSPEKVPASVVATPCRGREFVANLVKQLDALQVGVIAIDRYYPDDGRCRSDTKEEQDFVQTLASTPVSLSSPQTAVVVGLNSLVSSVRSDGEPVAGSETCVTEQSAVDFRRSNPLPRTIPRTVHGALLLTNSDALQIPLEWWAAPPADQRRDTPFHLVSGFAFQVYKQTLQTLSTEQRNQDDPHLIAEQAPGSLLRSIDEYDHPFANLPPEPPTRVSPADVLCAKPEGEALLQTFLMDEVASKSSSGPSQAHPEVAYCVSHRVLPDLRGKIVVIGVDQPAEDRHAVPGGEQKGVDLQAEYIEALLNNGYVRAAPWWLDWGIVALLFGEILYSERRFDKGHICYWCSFARDALCLVALLALSLFLLLHLNLLTPNFLGASGAIFITGMVTRGLESMRDIDKAKG